MLRVRRRDGVEMYKNGIGGCCMSVQIHKLRVLVHIKAFFLGFQQLYLWNHL